MSESRAEMDRQTLEHRTLGAMLGGITQNQMDKGLDQLEPEMFQYPIYATIFTAWRHLRRRSVHIDRVATATYLILNHPEYAKDQWLVTLSYLEEGVDADAAIEPFISAMKGAEASAAKVRIEEV